MSDQNDQSVRLDKWIWAARFFKTRSRAAKAIGAGKVHLNGRRVKRSTTVGIGDRVRIQRGKYEYRVVVQGLSERRGPASEARTLYEETAESKRAREEMARHLKAMPDFSYRDKGKPSKKERRKLERLRGFRKE